MDQDKLVIKVKASKPVPVFRPASAAKVVSLTAFDASFAKRRKERSHGRFITTITTCGVESGKFLTHCETSTSREKCSWAH